MCLLFFSATYCMTQNIFSYCTSPIYALLGQSTMLNVYHSVICRIVTSIGCTVTAECWTYITRIFIKEEERARS